MEFIKTGLMGCIIVKLDNKKEFRAHFNESFSVQVIPDVSAAKPIIDEITPEWTSPNASTVKLVKEKPTPELTDSSWLSKSTFLDVNNFIQESLDKRLTPLSQQLQKFSLGESSEDFGPVGCFDDSIKRVKSQDRIPCRNSLNTRFSIDSAVSQISDSARQYRCQKCSCSFKSKKTWQRHCRRKHKIENSINDVDRRLNLSQNFDIASQKEAAQCSDENISKSLKSNESSEISTKSKNILINKKSQQHIRPFTNQSDFKKVSKLKQQPWPHDGYLYSKFCKFCPAEFTDLQMYRQHTKQNHSTRQQCCRNCWGLFPDSLQYVAHSKICWQRFNSPENQLVCHICSASFTSACQLYQHQLMRHPNSCIVCNQTFTSLSLAFVHMRENHLQYKSPLTGSTFLHPCSHCPFITCDPVKLRMHEMKKHQIINILRVLICDMCQHKTTSAKAMRRHTYLHLYPLSLQEKLTCEFCGMLLQRHKLAAHKLNHTGQVFRCNECPLSFRKMHLLQRHIRSHTKEKPFQCEICAKCFSQSQNLTVHMRTHTKEKPFKCEICNMKFSHKCSLKGHVSSKYHLEMIRKTLGQDFRIIKPVANTEFGHLSASLPKRHCLSV